MPDKDKDQLIASYIKNLLYQHPSLPPILEEIALKKAIPYLVGGAVRDIFLHKSSKDIDIEVEGLSIDCLEKILQQFGTVSLVGKAFGVLKLHSLDIDWSVPRTDSAGRHPQVAFHPHLTPEQAFARRDLTINAMGINLLTHQLIDPFNGLSDLENHKLRTPNPILFIEDPLRFFRVMHFIARFQMEPDEELNQICATMNLNGLALERIAAEFDKLFLLSSSPSRAFVWLARIGRLHEIYPEIAATQGIPQDPEWHPEGDVWEHTLQALDAAAGTVYQNNHERLMILYAALCHDLGKVTTTKFMDNRWRSHGHDVEGERIAKKFLVRISVHTGLIDAACLLVRQHMMPGQLVHNQSTPAAYKRLAARLAPHVTLQQLALVAYADARGRNKNKEDSYDQPVPWIDEFLDRAHKANVLSAPEPPLLQGRDLLDVVKPGPRLGQLIRRAYQIQIDEGIVDKEEIKKRILTQSFED